VNNLNKITETDIDIETPILNIANEIEDKYKMKSFITPKGDENDTKPIKSTLNFSN